MNTLKNNDIPIPIFPPNRKYPIIKSSNLSNITSNPPSHFNIKNNFNKTTEMFINFSKPPNHNNIHNKDEFFNNPKHSDINIHSSESNENIRTNQQGVNNTYYHKALIPIEVGSTVDMNSDNEMKGEKDEEEIQDRDHGIDFEKINEVNKSRPQTSYGGLNARRKKLQTALKSAKYRTTNNNSNNIDN